MRKIFTCSCGNVPATAEASYRLHYRDEPPESIIGKDRIREFLPTTPPEVQQYLKALINSRQRFAYYMEWDDSHITHQYDLLKNKLLKGEHV